MLRVQLSSAVRIRAFGDGAVRSGHLLAALLTDEAVAARLVPAIKAVLEESIEAGGSSLRDYRQADGSLGYFQHAFAAYDREGQPCRHEGCAGTIARIVQSGRSTFFCPVCQR